MEQNEQLNNYILPFGKFKGQKFSETPKWYKTWLLKQDWFKPKLQENKSVNPAQQLKGWDGYSRKGQAAYDAMFELEQSEEAKFDYRWEWLYSN